MDLSMIFQSWKPETMAALSVIVPMVVAFITNTQTSAKVKGWLCAILSLAAGFAMAYGSGAFEALSQDPQVLVNQIIMYTAIIGVAAQTNYNMWIKPSGASTYVQANLGVKDETLSLEEMNLDVYDIGYDFSEEAQDSVDVDTTIE
jgi:hypothetical protein